MDLTHQFSTTRGLKYMLTFHELARQGNPNLVPVVIILVAMDFSLIFKKIMQTFA